MDLQTEAEGFQSAKYTFNHRSTPAESVIKPSFAKVEAPAWNTAELLDLISIWREESVQSQLQVTHRNRDTNGQISRGLCKKDYDRDTQQCRAKIKELRWAYHKAQDENHHSSGAPKTCRFYKELNAILDGDPTSTTNNPLDTLEAAERGGHLEAEILVEEVELEEDVELPAGSPGGAGRQELFSTPEVLNRSRKQMRCWTLRNKPRTPTDRLWQIRKNPRRSKEDMFQEVLQREERQTRERKECWEAERPDRKDNAAFARQATERMISYGGSDRDAQVFDITAD
ncbi:uncharacterized protein LOC123378731 [Mauremys mutica]|uniref:uncharacterized protein LOC123378731 n=1 Tax=Mauremys mutica TaxID=74926 RepID=UPI001D156B6F|nr:uncharacterized protein LOC123378731 [Mauremys mutica]